MPDEPAGGNVEDVWRDVRRTVRSRSEGRAVDDVADDLRRELARRGVDIPDTRIRASAEVIVNVLVLLGPGNVGCCDKFFHAAAGVSRAAVT